MNYPETIVRLRAPLVAGEYGDEVQRDWANAVETSIVGVQVQPSTSAEDVQVGRTPVTTAMRVLSPIGTDLDILETDRIRWNSVVWEVDGEVARHKRPTTGAVHHVEVMLTRVKG